MMAIPTLDQAMASETSEYEEHPSQRVPWQKMVAISLFAAFLFPAVMVMRRISGLETTKGIGVNAKILSAETLSMFGMRSEEIKRNKELIEEAVVKDRFQYWEMWKGSLIELDEDFGDGAGYLRVKIAIDNKMLLQRNEKLWPVIEYSSVESPFYTTLREIALTMPSLRELQYQMKKFGASMKLKDICQMPHLTKVEINSLDVVGEMADLRCLRHLDDLNLKGSAVVTGKCEDLPHLAKCGGPCTWGRDCW